MQLIDWIFLDIGGVLADESAYQQYRRTLCLTVANQYRPEVTDKDYAQAYNEASAEVGSLTKGVVRALMKDYPADMEAALNQLQRKLDSGPTYLSMEKIRPEAADVVANLARHYKLGIIANQPEGVRKVLEEVGILQYLSDCTISSDRAGKPDPAYFQQVLDKTGANPSHSLMVDDNFVRGILPAKAIGMQTVWFGSSEKAEGADYVVQDLRSLEILLVK